MSIEKKLLGTSPSGGDAANVADVFSTYLYEGTQAIQTITNGIDLAGEGGMVWIKRRGIAFSHVLADSERSGSTYLKYLSTDNTDGESTTSSDIRLFNSDGFEVGGSNGVGYTTTYASWTFRKAPRFFDCITWTGNATNRTIAHDLGCEVGMVIVKRTDASASWAVYHRSISNTKYLILEHTNYELTGSHWNSTTATDSVLHLGTDGDVNRVGAEYVAYLFAHDPDGADDDGMIACGSYTGNGSSDGPEINLGWEPQYVLIKGYESGGAYAWNVFDSMRGVTNNGRAVLEANTSSAELADTTSAISLTSTGFKIDVSHGYINTSAKGYIYMAIRAPMMKEPEAGTEVFQSYDCDDNTDHYPEFISDFPVDMAILKATGGGDTVVASRMTGATKAMYANTTGAEITYGSALVFDYMNGFYETNLNNEHAWMFKRAKGFFDVVAYSGNSTSGRTVNHSLGVVPEMMIVKMRDTWAGNWNVYHKDIGNSLELKLNSPGSTVSGVWNNTTPTDSVFTLDNQSTVNDSSRTYIAYLFATLDGVSKVGSYTGTGSALNIDCGFSNGARFVLIKRTDGTGDWGIFDTSRGIVSGNDSKLVLNDTAAEVLGTDHIDPYSSGFTLSGNIEFGGSGREYIFLAIA
jgi:hypothetical protein